MSLPRPPWRGGAVRFRYPVSHGVRLVIERKSTTHLGGPVPKLDTVVRDAPHGALLIHSEVQLHAYRTRFLKVEAVALEPDRSRDFIRRLAKEL